MNGASDINGKAPMNNNVPTGPIVHVEPPRREDLQPSYAQVIKADTEDEAQHGWYGGMLLRYRVLRYVYSNPYTQA